jgi:uncharacterized protein HemY
MWTIGFALELADDLNALGEHETARQLSADSLSRARRVLGDESLYTIDSANNLASALLALGQVETARQLSEETLTQARRVFGEHPRILKAAHNLAAALRLLREPT